MAVSFTPPAVIGKYQQRAMIVGAIGAILLLIGAFTNFDQFIHSYLVAFLYVLGLALGCQTILMLQHLVSGQWGLIIRRILEAASRTLPLVFILFLPILIWTSKIYTWAHPNDFKDDEEFQRVIGAKHAYLNWKAFALRAVIYFAIWYLFSYFLNKWSRQQDTNDDVRIQKKLQNISGPGFVIYGFTVSFAAIDWIMSLSPQWYSTIFGIITMGGQVLLGMSFTITILVLLLKYEPLNHIVKKNHLHDEGKLLLAFTMLWAYFNFSQFLIIWAGNLPEEIAFFLPRLRSGWKYIGLSLALAHFGLPFALLLSRDLKRNGRTLVMIASIFLVMRYVDLLWNIAPQYYLPAKTLAFSLSWQDIAAPIALVGIWLTYFFYQLRSRPLIPENDPRLPELLEAAQAAHH